jgi:hypothetical protein
MKTLHGTARPPATRRRGAALMMAVLVLLVLVMVVFQISISTGTDARIARNQTTLSAMDHAIESAMLQIFEDLQADAEADAASGQGGPGAGGLPGASGDTGGAGGAGGPGGAGGGQATDSSRDDWASVDRQDINEIELRVLYQDEDSKYNVLNMLTDDDDEARKAYDRVVRILDACREGTADDIDGGQAERMATAMLEHMERRSESVLSRPVLLTDDEERFELGLPMSLRELVVLEPFDESHFRDYRDENGDIVHSIGSFLTLWTSLTTYDELVSPGSGAAAPETPAAPQDAANGAGAGGQDGAAPAAGAQEPEPPTAPAVNVNRAPPAVLHSLMDDRDVPSYFWDALVEYRNEEDEEAEQPEEEDLEYSEFGEELAIRKIFNSVDDLAQLDGWETLEPIVQAEIRQLTSVQSHVFSLFITARRRTGDESQADFWDVDAIREEEESGTDLMRTVHCVVWRRSSGGDVEIVPIVRWELIDYAPYEVLDYPGEDR